jgi:hypothetical protein
MGIAAPELIVRWVGIELLGICFWREGFEGAFGPERRGRKGGAVDRAYELSVKISEKNDIIIPSFPHLRSRT